MTLKTADLHRSPPDDRASGEGNDNDNDSFHALREALLPPRTPRSADDERHDHRGMAPPTTESVIPPPAALEEERGSGRSKSPHRFVGVGPLGTSFFSHLRHPPGNRTPGTTAETPSTARLPTTTPPPRLSLLHRVVGRCAAGGGAAATAVVTGTRVRDSAIAVHPLFVLLVTAVVWPVGYRSFVALQSVTDSTFRPVPGTLSQSAQFAFDAAYTNGPLVQNASSHNGTSRMPWDDDPTIHPPLYVVLEAIVEEEHNQNNGTPPSLQQHSFFHNASSPAYQQARDFSRRLAFHLPTHPWSWDNVENGDHHSHNNNNNTSNVTASSVSFRVTDYPSLCENGLSWLGRGLVSPDGRSALLQIQYHWPPPPEDPSPSPYPSPPNDSSHDNNATTAAAATAASLSSSSHNRHRKNNDRDRIREIMAEVESFGAAYLNDLRSNGTVTYFELHYTGLPWFQWDLSQAAHQDWKRLDRIVVPLALVLLGFVLPRANPWAVWIIPLLTTITTIATWSIALYWVAGRYQITQFTPTLMMSLSVGLGIDYTLFLLARYLECPDCGADPSPPRRAYAVSNMLTRVGPVLLLSGTTLLATFLGLACLPLPMLQSVGIGAALAVAASLAVNLTLVPSLLLTPLGRWIVRSKRPPLRLRGDGNNNAAAVEDDQDQDDQDDDDQYHQRALDRSFHVSWGSDPRNGSTILPPPPPSLWYRLSHHLLHPHRKLVILLVTLQVLVPIALYAPQVQSSISFDLLLPETSPARQTYIRYSQKVGPGRLDPYRILLVAAPPQPPSPPCPSDGTNCTDNGTITDVTSAEGFDVLHLVVSELLAMESTPTSKNDGVRSNRPQPPFEWTGWDTPMQSPSDRQSNQSTLEWPPADLNTWHPAEWGASDLSHGNGSIAETLTARHGTSYSGTSVLDNTRIPHSVFVAAKYCGQLPPHCPVELLHVVDAVDRMVTAGDRSATFLTATLSVDPFSDEGVAWLVSARQVLESLETTGKLRGMQAFVYGAAAVEYDAFRAVYRAFPWVVVITTAVVFAITGVFFQSFFLPLRSVLSIGLTLAFSFGLGVLVFQKGVLDWTGLRGAGSGVGQDEFCWLVPIMSFSLVVGLALDYDVFLVSRILEYRLDGYEHQTSIAAALHSTGRIITAAGVIMAFAFGSLLFSSSPVLRQWSFVITSAVLLDTFVVRSVVVPIVTSMAGSRQCWWPRKLPEPRVTMPEFLGAMDDVTGLLRTLEESSEYESLHAAAAASAAVSRTP